MAISRLSTSRLTQGLPKYQSAWDQDNVQQGAVVPIASASLIGNAVRDITFTGIPQIYKDLRIVFSHRANSSAATTDAFVLYFENYNSPASGYSQTDLKGNGSSVSSTRASNAPGIICGPTPAINATAGIFGTTTMDIFNYANTSNFKTLIMRNCLDLNSSGETNLSTAMVRTTLALDRLTFFPSNGTAIWAAGTTCTLYGIKAGA